MNTSFTAPKMKKAALTLREWLQYARIRSARAGAHIAVRLFSFPPGWVGYRWLRSETVQQHLLQASPTGERQHSFFWQVHPESSDENPLPRNITARDELPRDRGWWGYSFWDVPARTYAETVIARLSDCRVVHHVDPGSKVFVPAIVSSDDRVLKLEGTWFQSEMAPSLHRPSKIQRIQKGTWILGHAYHNYFVWFTAHVSKILILQSKGLLDGLILPAKSSDFIESSLQMLGINREDFHTADPDATLHVDDLTIVETDRFRPELLRSVRNAFFRPTAATPHRRVFVSRAKADRRRLLNEEEIWSILEPAGFERVCMEDLTFAEQVNLMAETAILFALHGAGLTNMLFCASGTHVVEIADLSFPNPNFYAVASALRHHYWLLAGTPVGREHPLDRDMMIDPRAVRSLLPQLLESAAEGHPPPEASPGASKGLINTS